MHVFTFMWKIEFIVRYLFMTHTLSYWRQDLFLSPELINWLDLLPIKLWESNFFHFFNSRIIDVRDNS